MRFRKSLRDAQKSKGRIALIFLSLFVGLVAFSSIASIRNIVAREMTSDYQRSLPASVTFDVGDRGLDDKLFIQLLDRPEVQSAERRSTRLARYRDKKGNTFRAHLFFRARVARQDIATLDLVEGKAEAGPGETLIEKSAMQFFSLSLGESVEVSLGARTHSMVIVGVVHETALAPASTEQSLYLYPSPSAFERLTGARAFDEVRVLVTGDALSQTNVETKVRTLAAFLEKQKVSLHEIRVPPAGEHPHERPSRAVMTLLLIFAFCIFVLSALFTRSLLAVAMTRAQRELAIMRSMGAQSKDLRHVFILNLLVISFVAALASLPLVYLCAQVGSLQIADLINLRLENTSISIWVLLLHFVLALALPTVMAWPLFSQATTQPIHRVLYAHRAKIVAIKFGGKATNNPLFSAALRNAFRKPKRFVSVVLLLTASGALTLSAFSSARSWSLLSNQIFVQKNYSAEISFSQSRHTNGERVLPNVDVESWGSVGASVIDATGISLSRTYPDEGHGAFYLKAGPVPSRFLSLKVNAGRDLVANESGAVVLNQVAAKNFGEGIVGKTVKFSVEGKSVELRVVGIVVEVAAPAVAYTTPKTFKKNGWSLNVLKVKDASDLPETLRALTARGDTVQQVVSVQMIFNAMGEHVFLVIQILIMLGILMSIVGILSLGANTTISVVERTREFGVLRSIGASPEMIAKLVVIESLFTGLVSLPLSALFSALLSLILNWLIGSLAFSMPLPFSFHSTAFVVWSLALFLLCFLATLLPLKRANSITVVEAIAHV